MRNSLLARIFLFIAALLLTALIVTLIAFRHAQEAPRAQQLAQLVVSTVNMTRAALLAAAPEWRYALLAELAVAEGMQVQLSDGREDLVPLPNHPPELRLMSELVRSKLGQRTRFASARNGVPGVWVSFWIAHEEFWLAVPRERFVDHPSRLLLLWAGIISLFSLLGAYFIARQVTLPLRRVAWAARLLGAGRTPPPLPEQGAEELAAVSRAFNQMSTDLAAHARERALVLAGISHDLRTPLARVRLAAELSPDEQLRDGLIEDVTQMDAVIQQFLDYARLDASEAAQPTDLAALLHEAAQPYLAQAALWDWQLADLPPQPVRPLLLKRAVANLLDNAFKYGGGAVTLGLTAEEGQVCLSVCDRGPGIPVEQRALAMRPFARLDEARSRSGSGLGLAIVARVAQLHGGELRLLDNPGGGLRVELRWPLA